MADDHPLWNRARSDILLYSPFFGRALLSMPLVADPTCLHHGRPTCATDGNHVYYHPAAPQQWTESQRCGVLVHEILHPSLMHHVRRGDREPERWNIVCDYEVNDYVVEAGYELPEDAIFRPAEWVGLSAETMYDLTLPDTRAPGWGGVFDAAAQPGQSQQEALAKATQRWRQIRAQTRWGTLPGGVARALAEPKPVATLADVVAQAVTLALDYDNETWAPPSRRCVLLPGPIERPDGYVVIAVDTSGSMRDADVRAAISLALGVTGLGRLDVIYADAAIQSIAEDIHTADELLRAAKGGGGTDFRPALAEIARRAPDIALYITDGCGEYGAPQPGIIWVSPVQPPWGGWLNHPKQELAS